MVEAVVFAIQNVPSVVQSHFVAGAENLLFVKITRFFSLLFKNDRCLVPFAVLAVIV